MPPSASSPSPPPPTLQSTPQIVTSSRNLNTTPPGKGTSRARRCTLADCNSTHLKPLSTTTGTKRSIEWFCAQCRQFTSIWVPAPTIHDTFKNHLSTRQFTGSPFLQGDISQGDFVDHIADLYRRKAPGLDGIPYEFILDAEPELVELY